MNCYPGGDAAPGGRETSRFFELSPTNTMRKNAEDEARFYLNGYATSDMPR